MLRHYYIYLPIGYRSGGTEGLGLGLRVTVCNLSKANRNVLRVIPMSYLNKVDSRQRRAVRE